MSKWYTVKALAAGDDTTEIDVFGQIDSWGARQFVADLRGATTPNVRLCVGSPGGDVYAALQMFHAIRNSGKNVEAHVYGIAASAASFLVLAANKVVMPDNTFMFLHNPLAGIYGNADDHREAAEVLDKIGGSLRSTYAARWKGEADALDKVLADETYLTAAECLEYGLCDEVTPAIEAQARADFSEVPEAVRVVAFKPKAPEPKVEPPKPAFDVTAAIRAATEGFAVEGFAARLAVDPSIQTEAHVVEAVAAARMTMSLCDIAGMGERAADLVLARKPVAEVRAVLAEALAEADAARVDTAPPGAKPVDPPKPAGTFTNATDLWAQIRAAQAK